MYHNTSPQIYCRAIVLKTAWYQHKSRLVEQWNRIDDPEINWQSYVQLIFDKGDKTLVKKRKPIQQMFLTKLNMKLDLYLPPWTKIN